MKPFIKRLLWLAFTAPIVAFFSLWVYSSIPVRAPWAEFGYYGHFNQVQRIIRSMPDLSIIDSSQHHDVIMEDFSFTVAHRDRATFQICFWEGTPQMKLSSDADIRCYIEGAVAEQIRHRGSSQSSVFSPSPAEEQATPQN